MCCFCGAYVAEMREINGEKYFAVIGEGVHRYEMKRGHRQHNLDRWLWKRQKDCYYAKTLGRPKQ